MCVCVEKGETKKGKVKRSVPTANEESFLKIILLKEVTKDGVKKGMSLM